MIKDAVQFAKQLFSLTRDVRQDREDIKRLREEVTLIREDLSNLSRLVERLAIELQNDRQNSARQREMQQLRLENTLLRFERGLPRPPDDRTV